MNGEFKNKKIVIVGCSKGLGRSLAERLIREGAELLLFDISPIDDFKTDEIQNAGNYKSFTVDVSQIDGFLEVLKSVLNSVGQIDGLIYVVRGKAKKDMLDITPEDFDNMIDLTLKGLYFSVLSCVPYLRKSKDPFVVAFSSVSAEFVGEESGPYHVAKAGVEQLVRYFAVKLGKYGIRVNAIQPGMIVKDEHTGRFMSEENSKYRNLSYEVHPLKCVGDSNDVVDAILYLASKKAKFVTGHVLVVDGGLTIQDQFDVAYRFGHLG